MINRIIDWFINGSAKEQAKNRAFHDRLDAICNDMRRDVCMACGERCGDPHDDSGVSLCEFCIMLLERKVHPKVPDFMCQKYLDDWSPTS